MDKESLRNGQKWAFGHKNDRLDRRKGVQPVRQNSRRRPKAELRHHGNDAKNEWGSAMAQ
jgi:hypothetical protein